MQHTQSILLLGLSGIIVEVECQLSNGLPVIIVVGLGNKAIDEAKERIRSAFASCLLELPKKRIVVNLAPADIPKDSTSLDLAIAVAILRASGQPLLCDHGDILIGEIGLDGDIRPVRGIIGMLLAAKKQGYSKFLIPAGNLKQAMLVPGITITALHSLRQLAAEKTNSQKKLAVQESNPKDLNPDTYSEVSLSLVTGQERAKRALQIAAAGAHNVLLHGPPGSGKSMLAKAMRAILPPLSHEEILEVTHLHSLASHRYDDIITTAPFRSPHSSASYASIIGGGTTSKPGEISLSHGGVLFLDELPEYNRRIIEALRQPLEDKSITIARLRTTVQYPARFILLATANPCPCGFYGSSRCICTPAKIAQYRQRLSGPILDRIDMHVTVESIAHQSILNHKPSKSADRVMQTSIQEARYRQYKRYRITKTNGEASNAELLAHAALTPKATTFLNQAAQQLDISARSYVRLVKIARTIADLSKSLSVTTEHVAEALQYRPSQSD